jgi:hypothetical protein
MAMPKKMYPSASKEVILEGKRSYFREILTFVGSYFRGQVKTEGSNIGE